jgi:hypothetical protein
VLDQAAEPPDETLPAGANPEAAVDRPEELEVLVELEVSSEEDSSSVEGVEPEPLVFALVVLVAAVVAAVVVAR